MSISATFFRQASRLKVHQKILLGFLVILSLSAVLGIQSVQHIRVISQELDSVMDTGRDAITITRLAQDSERLDRAVLNYVVNQDEVSLAAARKEMGRFDTALQRLAGLGDGSTQAEPIRRAADEYRAAFADVVAAVAKRRDGIGQTFLQGAQLNTTAMAVVDVSLAGSEPAVSQTAIRLQQALQAVRMSTARYFTTYDPNDAATARDELTKLRDVLAAMPGQTANKRLLKFLAAMGPNVTAFGNGLTAAVDGHQALTAATTRTRTTLDRLTGAIHTLATAFTNAQRTAQEHATLSLESSERQMVIVPVAAILIGILFAVLIGSSIARPIRRITEAMVALAGGNTAVAIPAVDNRDEVGDMARAVQVFRDNAIEMDRLRHEQEGERARTDSEKRRAMGQLAQTFEGTVMGVAQHVVDEAESVEVNARLVAGIAEQTRQYATQGASATEEASANVRMVAEAVEELAASVAAISSQATESTTIARGAVSEAQQTNTVVASLAEAASRIGDVIHIIHNIASQTNLLALNATIEAARAGDAGKGFAVVASEVKTLANQTTSATDEIGVQIEAIQTATHNAVDAIRRIGGTIGQMDTIAVSIATAVQRQFQATQEISGNLHQAAQGTAEVSRTIGDVLHKATDAGHSADKLLQSAATLGHQTAVLKQEVNGFTDRIRTA